MPKTVVIDSNVLLSGLLTPDGFACRVVDHVLDKHLLLQSKDTVNELETVLSRPYFQSRIPSKRPARFS